MGEVLHSFNTIPIADLYSGTGGRYKTGARGGGHEGVDTSMTNTYRGWLSIQCLLTCTKYTVPFSVFVWSTHTHTAREGESARLRASISLFGTPPQSCGQFDREPGSAQLQRCVKESPVGGSPSLISQEGPNKSERAHIYTPATSHPHHADTVSTSSLLRMEITHEEGVE